VRKGGRREGGSGKKWGGETGGGKMSAMGKKKRKENYGERKTRLESSGDGR